jgi:hypothetical protein
MVDLNQNYGAFGNDRLPSLSTVVRSWQHDGSVRIDARAWEFVRYLRTRTVQNCPNVKNRIYREKKPLCAVLNSMSHGCRRHSRNHSRNAYRL